MMQKERPIAVWTQQVSVGTARPSEKAFVYSQIVEGWKLVYSPRNQLLKNRHVLWTQHVPAEQGMVNLGPDELWGPNIPIPLRNDPEVHQRPNVLGVFAVYESLHLVKDDTELLQTCQTNIDGRRIVLLFGDTSGNLALCSATGWWVKQNERFVVLLLDEGNSGKSNGFFTHGGLLKRSLLRNFRSI